MMEGRNGIETGQELYSRNHSAKIIYTTNFGQYCMPTVLRQAVVASVVIVTLVNLKHSTWWNMGANFLVFGIASFIFYEDKRGRRYWRVLESECFFMMVAPFEGIGVFGIGLLMDKLSLMPGDIYGNQKQYRGGIVWYRIKRSQHKMEYVLKTNHLTKTISGKDIVSDIELHVKKGEIYGFLGPNGAGKTSIMKMITNLWKPTSGTIELFGGGRIGL